MKGGWLHRGGVSDKDQEKKKPKLTIDAQALAQPAFDPAQAIIHGIELA